MGEGGGGVGANDIMHSFMSTRLTDNKTQRACASFIKNPEISYSPFDLGYA